MFSQMNFVIVKRPFNPCWLLYDSFLISHAEQMPSYLQTIKINLKFNVFWLSSLILCPSWCRLFMTITRFICPSILGCASRVSINFYASAKSSSETNSKASKNFDRHRKLLEIFFDPESLEKLFSHMTRLWKVSCVFLRG